MAANGDLTVIALCTHHTNDVNRNETPRRRDVCDKLFKVDIAFGSNEFGGSTFPRMEPKGDFIDPDQIGAINTYFEEECDYPANGGKYGVIRRLFNPLRAVIRAGEHVDIGHDITLLSAMTLEGLGQKLTKLDAISNDAYYDSFSENCEDLQGYVFFIYDKRKNQIISFVTSPGCKAYWVKNVGVALKQITKAARFDKQGGQ